jgi:DNA repair protein RadC
MSEFNQASKFWEDLKSGKFAEMVRESTKGQEVASSLVAYHILKPLFAETAGVETMYCIFLNGQNKVIAIEKVSSGTLNCAVVYPREILKRILALHAGAIIMSHNHPSGNTEPSAADMSLTGKVIFALATIDALVHDHLIVGDGYHSMSDCGALQSIASNCRNILNQNSYLQ